MSCDESSVNSSSTTPSSADLICRVCGFAGHGLHFGVVTCRACAAFFRRFVVLNLKYKCLKNKTRCSLDRIRRSSCRQCRFQKCLEMGMSAKNVQWHRDVTAIDRKFKNLKPEGQDPPLLASNNSIYRPSIFSSVDYESIAIEAQRIFRSDIPSTSQGHFASLGPLQKFTEGLKLIRTAQRAKDIKFENRLSEKILIPHWKAQAKNTATLMMHCALFREFSFMEKCRIFKNLWKSLYRLERIQMSVELFGEDCVNHKILAISTDRAIQLDDLFFNFHWVSDKDLELMLQCFLGFSEKCLLEIARPLCKLKLSLEEVSFLILNFIFFNKEYLPDSFSESRENFLQALSDELHSYYQKNDIVNYASRISNIMKIVNSMRKIHYDNLAGVFVDLKKRNKSF